MTAAIDPSVEDLPKTGADRDVALAGLGLLLAGAGLVVGAGRGRHRRPA